MADKQLNALTAAAALSTADLFLVEQSGNSRKATGTQVQTLALAAGVLAADATNTSSTATTSEETLKSYTLPGNTLSDNQAIRISASGTLAATTRSRRIELEFGGVSCVALASTSSSVVTWKLDALLYRRNSTTFLGPAHLIFIDNTAAIAAQAIGNGFSSALDFTSGIAITIRSTVGVGATAADTGCSTFMVERAG